MSDEMSATEEIKDLLNLIIMSNRHDCGACVSARRWAKEALAELDRQTLALNVAKTEKDNAEKVSATYEKQVANLKAENERLSIFEKLCQAIVINNENNTNEYIVRNDICQKIKQALKGEKCE